MCMCVVVLHYRVSDLLCPNSNWDLGTSIIDLLHRYYLAGQDILARIMLKLARVSPQVY